MGKSADDQRPADTPRRRRMSRARSSTVKCSGAGCQARERRPRREAGRSGPACVDEDGRDRVNFDEIKPPFYKELLRAKATLTFEPGELPRIPASYWTYWKAPSPDRSPFADRPARRIPGRYPNDINLAYASAFASGTFPASMDSVFFGLLQASVRHDERTPILEPVPKRSSRRRRSAASP